MSVSCHIRLSIRTGPLELPPEQQRDPEVDRWVDPLGREYGFGYSQSNGYLLRVHGVGVFVIGSGFSDVTGFPDEGLERGTFRDAFFHGVAPWILQRQDCDCLHGSAVLAGGVVIAFCGPGGSGKSTMARAWLDRGAPPYADDAVPFLAGEHSVMAGRIPQRLRLHEPAASLYAEPSRPRPERDNAAELRYDLRRTLRPLRVIYWLQPMRPWRGVAAAKLERIPRLEALRLLLGEARFLSLRDDDCNRKMVRNYLSLAGLVPVFRCRYPLRIEQLRAVVDCLWQHHQDLTAC